MPSHTALAEPYDTFSRTFGARIYATTTERKCELFSHAPDNWRYSLTSPSPNRGYTAVTHVGMFWPETSQESARNALRQAVHVFVMS